MPFKVVKICFWSFWIAFASIEVAYPVAILFYSILLSAFFKGSFLWQMTSSNMTLVASCVFISCNFIQIISEQIRLHLELGHVWIIFLLLFVFYEIQRSYRGESRNTVQWHISLICHHATPKMLDLSLFAFHRGALDRQSASLEHDKLFSMPNVESYIPGACSCIGLASPTHCNRSVNSKRHNVWQ